MNPNHYLDLCFKEAKKALSINELPIAALLTNHDQVIAKNFTQDKKYNSRIAHAELLLLKEAESLIKKDHHLKLFTTLEPCIMCYGAAMNMGVKEIFFALSSKSDGIQNLCQFHPIDTKFKYIEYPEIYGPLAPNKALSLFKDYLINNPINNGYTYWVKNNFDL